MDSESTIFVDGNTLNAVTGALEAARSRLNQAGQQFKENSQVTYVPGDAYSDTLQSWYDPAVQNVSDSATGLGSSVGGISDSITTTNDAYSAADEAAGM
jgi:phospholipase/lecithinase/hemolysin